MPLDDGTYVLENPRVRAGLNTASAAWAFTTFHGSNWHPLTWLSHMLDVQLFGLRAGGHHASSLLLHAAAAALLFLALESLTGARWRSALAAALFAVHPLRVESVAWVAERKDVLCGVFWGLALLLYGRYAARPSPGRYLALAGAAAGALLAKPTAVTLPLVLLLLDYWPLGRWRPAGGGGRPAPAPAVALLVEKLPLLALAAGTAALTLLAQRAGGALGTTAVYPLGLRAANAAISAARYVLEALWPANLAVIHPFPRAYPDTGLVVAAALFVAAATLLAFRARRARPSLSVGWLWYLVTIAPVLGLVQAGDQARADRYTYLSLTGLSIALAWAAGDVAGRAPRRRALAGAAAGAGLAVLCLATARQVRTWADGLALFTRAVQVAPHSHVAQASLGSVLLERGDLRGAKRHFFEAIRLDPGAAEPYLQLAGALLDEGDARSARAALDQGLRLNPARAQRLRRDGALQALERAIAAATDRGVRWLPRDADDHFALGMQRRWRGELPAAEAAFRAAARLRPSHGATQRELAGVLAATGRRDQALAALEEAVRLDPRDPVARNLLGIALGDRGRLGAAREHFAAGVRLRPDSAEGRHNLGLALEQLGRVDEAATQYRAALRLAPDFAEARRRLERLAPQGGPR